MRRPALVLVLAVLLAFDLATPLLPGAFRFDPDESVDGLRPSSTRGAAVTPSRLPAPPPVLAQPARPPSTPSTVPVVVAVHRREAGRSADPSDGGSPPSRSEDH